MCQISIIQYIQQQCTKAVTAKSANSSTQPEHEQIAGILLKLLIPHTTSPANLTHTAAEATHAQNSIMVDLIGAWAIALVLLFGTFFSIAIWLFCRKAWVLRHVPHSQPISITASDEELTTNTAKDQADHARKSRRKRKFAMRRARKRSMLASNGIIDQMAKDPRLAGLSDHTGPAGTQKHEEARCNSRDLGCSR